MKPLNQVGDLASILSFSPITQSPLWNKQLSSITKYNLAAWVARMEMSDSKKAAAETVTKLLSELHRLREAGEEVPLELLSYKLPRPTLVMTSNQLIAGLESVKRPYAAALLFALETGWDAELVIAFKWGRLKIGEFSETAQMCLKTQPRHIRCEYVFWRESKEGVPQPLIGLEQMVFEVFGMTWEEFLESGRTPITLSNEDFSKTFGRTSKDE